MLGLTATAKAKDQLRELRKTNPDLLERISERLQALRSDPGGQQSGRVFLLDDGSTARLATYYDHVARRDLALIWTIELDAESGTAVLKLVRAENVG